MEPLRIAILPQGHRALPPAGKVLSAPNMLATKLALSLEQRGHDVTLFAAQESTAPLGIDSAGLSSLLDAKEQFKWSEAEYRERQWQYDLYAGFRALESMPPFDIIHAHDHRRLPFLAASTRRPILYTLHGAIPESALTEPLKAVLGQGGPFNKFVAASRSQQENSAPQFQWVGVIHHGIDLAEISFVSDPPSDYLFVGRLVPKKQAEHAILAATRVGTPLRVVGQPGKSAADQAYYQQTLAPLLATDFVTHKGFIEQPGLFAEYPSRALLFPTAYEEAFGLVMVEAMAAGTPIIAYDKGPVREIVEDGVTGFIVSPEAPKKSLNITQTGIDGLAEAIQRMERMEPAEYEAMRRSCRQRVEKFFSLEVMTEQYEQLYVKMRMERGV